ncbi:unnamed protein product [Protopolystoma xenopodis]|uniref:Uncharacterized protein n=1 Tax=Protopolystoma xenopodis TaxID=117903 RepID=A0A3S5A804_9PLAT|nr:unnamed protein product [Protopolystoma xenopodis]
MRFMAFGTEAPLIKSPTQALRSSCCLVPLLLYTFCRPPDRIRQNHTTAFGHLPAADIPMPPLTGAVFL